MRIARVVGTVTMSAQHDSYRSAALRVVRALTLDDLLGSQVATGDELVAWDELGAGEGSLIALAEGPEAAQPFRPEQKAVDAYVTALLDTVEITHRPSVGLKS